MTKRMVSFGTDVIKQISGDLNKDTPVFGIDLGTTNSAVSVITHGDKPEAITLVNGKQTMPSCVMWKDGEFIVGEEAYKRREFANVIYSVKRYMQTVGKKIVLRDGSREIEMTPAEVSAEILKGLVKQTGGVYGEIKDVIVTVPAYFDQNGRNATREACTLAGLNLLDILNEPTAASLCYDVADEVVTEFVAFDFGGGTFDVTLARIIKDDGEDDFLDIYDIGKSSSVGKTVECMAIEGDSYLGGDDIDRELYRILCRKLGRCGIDISKIHRESQENLILRLERIKKSGTTSTYNIEIDMDLTDGTHVEKSIEITPEDFWDALAPSYRKCKKILDRLLAQNPNTADKIVLVGGSTKNPQLVSQLRKDYPNFQISDALNQDLAVSLGAAVKGKITKFGSENMKVFDILPMSIGVLDDGRVTPILAAGTVLPAVDTMNFTTTYDNQERMLLQVLQGNSIVPEECVSLGQLEFSGMPKVPAGKVNLSVTIQVTATSQMSCIGRVNGESKELELDLTGELDTAANMQGDAKLLKRWKATAMRMPAEDRAALEKMIDAYPDIVSKNDIMNFIREHTSLACGSRRRL